MTRSSEPPLQYEGAAAEALIAGYDRTGDRWDFPCVGPFWDALAEAHRRGERGGGRRVAILDSGFDRTIPALARDTTERLPNRPGADLSHGTAVALLVRTAAPDATLDLYAIGGPDGPDRHAVRAALRKVAGSDAAVLCMSLGVAVPFAEVRFEMFDPPLLAATRPARCPSPSGCLCDAVEAAAASRTIFAAVGNDAGGVFCPAMTRSARAIGFQLERRAWDDERGESAWATAPGGYGQSDAADYTLVQPPGVLGSSFATPLVAGAAALQDDPAVIPAMQDACRTGAVADALLAAYRSGPRRDPAALASAIGLYDRALLAFPHLDALRGGDHWCVGCALYGGTLFVNAGLARIEATELDLAERLLRIARGIAPLSADAAANLATCLEMRGAPGEAVALFDEAMALRPGYRGYDNARAQAATAADLSQGGFGVLSI